MTKTLLIMRHAKSSWDHGGLSDHDRPLNKRGLRDAPRMAKWISKKGLVPELVVSSTAKRAVTTANLFVESCDDFTCEVQTTSELYHAPATRYLETVIQFPAAMSTAMVVGHNPGLEDFVEFLAGNYERMPTGAIACFEFPIESWNQISRATAVLKNVWRPKEI